MKKILLTLLFATNCHANNQLQEELNAKQAQLSLLTEQIMQKEEKLSLILEKIQDAIAVLKRNKKEFLKNAISDNEIADMYMSNIGRFLEELNDIHNKKSRLIFDSDILKEATAITKFYIIIYTQENIKLETLIKKWADLSDEISCLKMN